MTVQRCEKIFSTYTDNDSNTMKKQGCLDTSYTDNDCNITPVDGRWWALKKADWLRLKKDGLGALKKADLGCLV
jgi:hypothetical protein